MSLAFTVLGGSPAWPNPGQAASGYVVESDGTRLLMDCGSGIAAELRARDPGPLTAIVISHFHADHWFDLVPLHYAYLFGNWNTRHSRISTFPRAAATCWTALPAAGAAPLPRSTTRTESPSSTPRRRCRSATYG